jgi:hypothetical protein
MKEYQLTEEETRELIEASKHAAATPVIYTPMPGQKPEEVRSWADHARESVMDVWRRLGDKYGFIWDTADDSGKGPSVVLAEPKPAESNSNRETTMTCKFSRAWIGECDKEADESGFCREHGKEKCCVCGTQATRTCSETMALVCGAPLCDDCEHTTQSNGYNSQGELPKGLHAHCRKGEQVFIPWFYPNANEKNAAALAANRKNPS